MNQSSKREEGLEQQLYEKCEECNRVNTRDDWCQSCNSKRFRQNFDNWTSGTNDIDGVIQKIQLSAKDYYELLEWIPYEILNILQKMDLVFCIKRNGKMKVSSAVGKKIVING